MDTTQTAIEAMHQLILHQLPKSIDSINRFSRGETFVLTYLLACSETAIPSELSEAMKSSTARITAILSSLEKKGQIVRQNAASDRRKVLVYLTDKGRQRAEQEMLYFERLLRSIFQEMGEDNVQHFMHTFSLFLKVAERQADLLLNNCTQGSGLNEQ